MKEIILPVHPMSRRILLAEQDGIEPVVIRNHDTLFGILSSKTFRPRQAAVQLTQTLTSTVSILLDDDIARHVIADGYHIGWLLFRLHKETMCRYVQACVLNGILAMHAIRQYYAVQGVTEDDYQEESAWKSWTRWSKTRTKKPVFCKQKTGNPAAEILGKKRRRAKLCAPLQPCRLTYSETVIELATARFLSAYSRLFRRVPKRMEKHVRVYYYSEVYGLSSYEAARKLGITPWSAWYACRAIQQRATKNKAIARLLLEQIALPHHA